MIPSLRLIALYMLLLVIQVGQVLEEVCSRIGVMSAADGMGWLLFLYWALFVLPMILFFFVLLGQRWAYTLSQGYAMIMIVNSLAHVAAFIITGRYLTGWGAVFTAAVVFIVSPLLFRALRLAKLLEV
jgi:hypothetical protein